MEVGVIVCSVRDSNDEFHKQLKHLAEILIEPLRAMAEEYNRLAALITDVYELAEEVMEREKVTYELQIKHVSKRQLKMINNKAINQIVFRTPRESHRNRLEEEEEDNE